ncbi:hypothetical protein [Planococcus sp. YIM B11945]|uniref:hypothetical protein n=1 Tax=Planococcus sp. YIM B11945 TaxID=3435410 RepID=UPI003D7EC8B9
MDNLHTFQNYDQKGGNLKKDKYEVFNYEHNSGTIKHTFIKRQIPLKVEGVTYYDLITPGVCGGPVIAECQEDEKWDLVYDFVQAFEEYCIKNNIVSEIIHFNPFLLNAVDFCEYYEIQCTKEFMLFLNKQPIVTGNFKYCIGKKIWNEKIYRELCIKANMGASADEFPAYRTKY